MRNYILKFFEYNFSRDDNFNFSFKPIHERCYESKTFRKFILSFLFYINITSQFNKINKPNLIPKTHRSVT